MSKISLRYARALITAADNDSKKIVALAEELAVATEVLNQSEAQTFFSALPPTKREQTMEELFTSADLLLVNFLKLIAMNGKMNVITEINQSFQELANEIAGIMTARIETTEKLSAPLAEKISSALAKLTGKQITLETALNPTLLGGVRISLGGDIIDLSLAGKLKKLTQALN